MKLNQQQLQTQEMKIEYTLQYTLSGTEINTTQHFLLDDIEQHGLDGLINNLIEEGDDCVEASCKVNGFCECGLDWDGTYIVVSRKFII